MLYPEEMKKVRIVALKSIYDSLVNLLGKLGVMHVSPVKEPTLQPPATREQLERLEAKVLPLASLFAPLSLPKPLHILTVESMEKHLKDLEPVVTPLLKEKEIMRELKSRRLALEETLKELRAIRRAFGPIKRPAFTNVVVGVVDGKNLAKLKEALPKPNHVFVASAGKNTYYVLVFSKEDPTPAFSRVNAYIVDIFGPHSSLDEYMAALEKELEEIKEREEAFNRRLAKALSHHGLEIAELIHSMNIYKQREKVEKDFGTSRYFVVLEGWVPAKKLSVLKEKLSKKFDGKVAVEVVRTDEKPPTLLSNPGPVRPFEEIVKLISLPSAKEIDPSFIYLFTIPFIYGMIIGDVIYSLISIVVAYVIKKKFKHPLLRAVADIWMLSSVFGIAWGIFYDEWAASPHTFWLAKLREFGFNVPEKLYEGFGRVNKVSAVIGLSILVGIIYLAFGFILGIVNALREGHLKHAIAKAAWLSTLLSLFYAIGIYLSIVPGNLNTALLWLGASAFVLLITEGPIAILEISSLFGNVLSFARIAAVGVVGAVMGELINHAFAPSPAAGLLNVLLIPLLISLHFFNALLAMFEALIQGGRLNLVEFGTKFFHGGGYPYKPFSFSRGEKHG